MAGMGMPPPSDLYRRRRVTREPSAPPPGRWSRALTGARRGAILAAVVAVGLLYGQLYLGMTYAFDPQWPVLLVFALSVLVAILRR